MKHEKNLSENEPEERIILPEIGNKDNNIQKDEANAVPKPDIQSSESDTKKHNRDLSGNIYLTEKDLSEGEASSGFETVSSIDHNVDADDIDLSIPADEDDMNVIIEIENELAFQNGRGRRTFYWKSKNKTRKRNRIEAFSGDYNNRRQDDFRISRDHRYWQSKNEERWYKYDRRVRKSTEREDFSRRPNSHDHDWSRSKNQNARHRGTKGNGYGSRPRRSTSSERNYRSRSSRSLERTVSMTSPRHKDRKKEGRHSGSFESSSTKLNVKRNYISRKRRNSRSPISSVWKRLDNRISQEREHNGKNSTRNFSRKKERTPFLVELERKLKEADQLKNEATNETLDKNEISINMNNPQPMPELSRGVNQTTTPSCMPMYYTPASNFPGVGFPFQYTPVPTLSVDNLPLVPGPSGLPVHITATGEQIPHDLDGRCIPVGPNGYYLPLDPTGRLFPHIISPGNQAVPIHMTEDGVLRLPNSDPVPYGPSHQLPVNIDGNIIPIGPDSKPLYPCLNLPRHPPLYLLNMMNSLGSENTGLQKIIQTEIPPPEKKEIIRSQKPWENNEGKFEAPDTNSSVKIEGIQIPQNSETTELLKKKKKTRERCNEVLKPIEIGSSVDLKTYGKFSEEKSSKDDTSICDMVLESSDSDTSGLNSRLKPKKGSIEEIMLSSDEEKIILNRICGEGSSKMPNTKKETEDMIIKKVKHAIKSLHEKNYKPPVFGRFIISDLEDTPAQNSTNESPLLRNRLMLPFLMPNANSPREKDKLFKQTTVTFKFLPQKKTSELEKPSSAVCSETKNENLNTKKFPVFTFDFAMQCDFTSLTIKNLTSKVAELEMEVVRLRNINANLLDEYRNVQAVNQKKDDELSTTLLEIRERNTENQSLKHCA